MPSVSNLEKTQLVREDLSIEETLGIAVAFRPELESFRNLIDAAIADRKETWCTGLGPTVSLANQYGGITGHANNVVPAEGIPGNLIVNPASTNGSFSSNPFANELIKEGILRGSKRLDRRDDQTYSFSDQQRATAAAGRRLSLSTLGDLKTAKASEQQALVRFERVLDEVRAEAVAATQAARTNDQLIVGRQTTGGVRRGGSASKSGEPPGWDDDDPRSSAGTRRRYRGAPAVRRGGRSIQPVTESVAGRVGFVHRVGGC